MEENNTLRSTPKDVFLQLFNTFTFYLSVIGFITLYVQYINALFPDALNYYFSGISDAVRVASSILLIAIPAYLFSAWLLANDLIINPKKRELKLRKWITYFTLFVSAVTIVIDLITFVYRFLGGELTTRFFLKILVVLVVASGVFGYYMWDLKRSSLVSKIPKVLGTILSLMAVVSVVAGFFIIGTPFDQRRRLFDEQRVQNLQMIQNQVMNYWTQKAVLPTNLIQLNDSISGFSVPSDPKTNKPYTFNTVNQYTFVLCADFETDSDTFASSRTASKYIFPDENQNWNHKAERTCFERKIDPELYKTKPGSTEIVPIK